MAHCKELERVRPEPPTGLRHKKAAKRRKNARALLSRA
jgi:hypothetical protein